jgi:RNA recognition motif-containing protein
MGKKLYVGNLPFTVDDDSLRAKFSAFGEVTSAQVIIDRIRNRSKGFGFVEFANDADADAAINGLNGREFDGREITVNEARPMESRPPRTGGGFGGPRREGGRSGGFGGGGREGGNRSRAPRW